MNGPCSKGVLIVHLREERDEVLGAGFVNRFVEWGIFCEVFAHVAHRFRYIAELVKDVGTFFIAADLPHHERYLERDAEVYKGI